ncbi:MAG: hypothetical protein C4K49_07980 [Candidatus Thorarchaeota archaeon]|nr:MAG: hypothetical protein C4K49_07980 [Candidatus Thorarchaeota archaeon]
MNSIEENFAMSVFSGESCIRLGLSVRRMTVRWGARTWPNRVQSVVASLRCDVIDAGTSSARNMPPGAPRAGLSHVFEISLTRLNALSARAHLASVPSAL